MHTSKVYYTFQMFLALSSGIAAHASPMSQGRTNTRGSFRARRSGRGCDGRSLKSHSNVQTDPRSRTSCPPAPPPTRRPAPPKILRWGVAALWALTDCTETNGATRLIPGSHMREDAGQQVDGREYPGHGAFRVSIKIELFILDIPNQLFI